MSPYLFLPVVSERGELPQHVGVHATTMHPAVLCCAVWGDGEGLALLMELEAVFVSSGTDSKYTLVWLESNAAQEDRVLCLP